MLHSPLLRIVCFLLLVACAVVQLRYSVQEQMVFSRLTDKMNEENLRSPRVLTYQAKEKHLFEADMGAAYDLLIRALVSNPVYIPAWLSLAELYNDEGKTDRALAVFRYVDKLLVGVNRWRWDMTLTAYQLGLMEKIPDELNYIIREIPGKNRNDALKLAFTIWKDPRDVLENVGPENIMHLFVYAVNNNLLTESLYFWRLIEKDSIPWEKRIALSFIQKLMNNGEIPVASQIWFNHFNNTSLLYNGDFSNDFLMTAFGWRTAKDKGFISRLDPAETGQGRILNYRFKGWENLNFAHLFQVVPLTGGKSYQFSAMLKSKKLTTNERPFFDIYGFKCKAPYTASEMVGPDQDWTEMKVAFEVPDTCHAMVVRLRRRESNHIDSKVSGQLWLRDLSITELAQSPEKMQEQQP